MFFFLKKKKTLGGAVELETHVTFGTATLLQPYSRNAIRPIAPLTI